MAGAFLDASVPTDNFLRRRDARAKLIALLAVLIALSLSRAHLGALLLLLVLPLVCALAARLPVLNLLRRAALVLPFCAIFAIFAWLDHDRNGAALLVIRACAAGCNAVLFVAVTPISELLRALEQFHAPRFLLTVTQLLYRYLFVLMEDAQQARTAARSRGGFKGSFGFRGAAGALAVLFARSHMRADQINQAMISRGYNGGLPVLHPHPFRIADAILIAISVTLSGGIAFAVRY